MLLAQKFRQLRVHQQRQPRPRITRIAPRSDPALIIGNSSTPEGARKHLNPLTPSRAKASKQSELPSTSPPQNPKSTPRFPLAAARFARNPSTLVVAGIEFNGISISVVYPPATAARDAVSKPSHSVRPGSLICTCVSISPGKIA